MALLQELDTGTPIRSGPPTVALTIDGRQVSVPHGTSVMAAAALIGDPVPKLCATDSLEAFGSCRLCLGEIEGRKGTPASCTTPVAEGIKVNTQTERLAKLRRGVMELYLSDHPGNPRGEMLEMVDAVGLTHVRYGLDGSNHLAPTHSDGSTNPRFKAKDESNPYFAFDPAKC